MFINFEIANARKNLGKHLSTVLSLLTLNKSLKKRRQDLVSSHFTFKFVDSVELESHGIY